MQKPTDPDATDPDATVVDGPGKSPGGAAAETAESPDVRLDRFELRRPIGRGGMGEVWEAWDPRLDRVVAIKRLRALDPLARRRFLREARLQAAIQHPGVCPVFEVGQADGVPFLVMPRLDGQPLDRACEGLVIEAKLVLLRQVAEAVHAAHREGLVHRDLKPSNILVETPGDGPPRPVVLDFGIARALRTDPAGEGTPGRGDDGLTATGQVMGTPAYMAPEQVRGEIESLDRRTDVYALGATLYRLLAGRTPHEGEGGTLLIRILRDTPPRLRPAGIPADVEAIVFRCLEKDPHRRYDSALALAEDLGRYLEGRPVRARRIGPRVRFLKWLGRHRAAVRVAAVAAFFVLGALCWGAWSTWRSEERQRLARQFGAQVEEIEALARYSHLVPLHDVRPDRVRLRRRLETIRAHLDDADPAVRALAHHAVGRGHLALDDLETAREHLETARRLAPDDLEIAVDLGRALSELYRDRLTSLERIGDHDRRDSVREQLSERLDATFGQPDEQQKQLANTLGEPARALLASGHPPEDRSPENDQALLLEVLRLFHEGRPDDALERLERAPPGPSWDYERKRLEGDIRRSWAVALEPETEARRQLERARRAYGEALEVAESSAAILRDDAQTVYLLAQLELVAPEEVEPLVEEGLARLDRARIAEPDEPRSWLWTARLQLLAAEHAVARARDPRTRLESAVEAARRALELDEGSSTAWYLLGHAHWREARRAQDRGEDPDRFFADADAAFERVAEEDRGYAFFTFRGLLHMAMAGRRAELGLDATEAYHSAITAYRRAAELHSAPFAALANLGVGLFHASALEGTSPHDLLNRAVETFEQARDLDPESMLPHYYLGLADLRLAQDGDRASPTLDVALAERAASHLARASRSAPDRFQPWVGSGEVFHLLALDAHTRGRDPEPFFARARDAHDRALELAPEHPTVLLNLAWTAYFEGKFALRAGRDAEPLLAEAEDLCRRTLEARRRVNALLCLGSVHRLQAEALVMEEASDAAEKIAAARQNFEALLELDPDHAEAHRSLGRLFTLEARWVRGRCEDPAPALARARRALDRALELEDDQLFFWLADVRWALESIDALGPSDGGQADAEVAETLDRARHGLERARREAPDSPEVERLESRLETLQAGTPPGDGSG